ncbi:MAG: hypothetical protein WB439_03410 [Acidobacteriaceae bacterium]
MPIQLCTHRFLDNHKCGSPALRGELYCYFHHPRRRPTSNRYERQSRRGFTLPTPRSQREVQDAIGQITERLASNKIDVNRASVLLYGLQLASQSFPPF